MSPQQIRHFLAEDDPTIAHPERITHVMALYGSEDYFHLGCMGNVSRADLEDYFVPRYAPKETRTCAECGGPIHKRKEMTIQQEIDAMKSYRKQIGGDYDGYSLPSGR